MKKLKNFPNKELRKISNLIGLSFILEILIANVIYIIFYKYDLFKFSKNLLEIFITLISFIIPYAIMLFILNRKLNDVVPIKKPLSGSLAYVGFGLGFNAIFSIITEFILKILKDQNLTSETPKALYEFDRSPIGILIYLIYLSVLPALVEEFMCRGFFLNLLKPYGTKFAMFVSALLFSLMHGNVEQSVSALFLGLYLAYLVIKTESIWPAVFLHFLNNLITGIFIVFNLYENKEVTYFYYNALLVVFVISLMYLFAKTKGHIFKLKNNVKSTSFLKNFLVFLFTPGIILFIFYVLFMFKMSFTINE